MLNQSSSRRTSIRPPGSFRQQAPFCQREPAGLVEIFGDRSGAGHDEPAILAQHRRRPGGIELEELAPPFPDALFDQRGVEAELAECEPDEARMRAKRIMVKRGHRLLELRTVRVR
jgi:hypothetical protein